MKKKLNFSIFTIVSIIVGIVGILYFFLYLMPANQQRGLIQAETRLFTAQAQLLEPYLEDHTPLLNNIEDIEASIAELHATGYSNASTFNTVLAESLQRYQLELTSLTLDEMTTFQSHKALPINLQVKGPRQSVLSFVNFFETNEEGSYVVRPSAMKTDYNDNCTLSIVMYLCSPAVE